MIGRISGSQTHLLTSSQALCTISGTWKYRPYTIGTLQALPQHVFQPLGSAAMEVRLWTDSVAYRILQ